MAEKKISGVFTVLMHSIRSMEERSRSGYQEYVLTGYGTGLSWRCLVVMNVTYKFAKHFNIPITNIIGSHYNGEEANPTKDAVLENSDFFNGMVMKDAIGVVIQKLEESGIGDTKSEL